MSARKGLHWLTYMHTVQIVLQRQPSLLEIYWYLSAISCDTDFNCLLPGQGGSARSSQKKLSDCWALAEA